jgi:hypothetical protein
MSQVAALRPDFYMGITAVTHPRRPAGPGGAVMLKDAKAFLNELGNTLHQRIEALSDDQLRQIIAGCDQLTETNCWYTAYRLAPAVREAAEDHLHSRLQPVTPTSSEER